MDRVGHPPGTGGTPWDTPPVPHGTPPGTPLWDILGYIGILWDIFHGQGGTPPLSQVGHPLGQVGHPGTPPLSQVGHPPCPTWDTPLDRVRHPLSRPWTPPLDTLDTPLDRVDTPRTGGCPSKVRPMDVTREHSPWTPRTAWTAWTPFGVPLEVSPEVSLAGARTGARTGKQPVDTPYGQEGQGGGTGWTPPLDRVENCWLNCGQKQANRLT